MIAVAGNHVLCSRYWCAPANGLVPWRLCREVAMRTRPLLLLAFLLISLVSPPPGQAQATTPVVLFLSPGLFELVYGGTTEIRLFVRERGAPIDPQTLTLEVRPPFSVGPGTQLAPGMKLAGKTSTGTIFAGTF